MTDIISGLISYLGSITSVTTLVSDRIYGGELPEDEIENMPQKVVVLKYSGGLEITRSHRIQDQRIDVFSYGESYYEAQRVDYVIVSALYNLSREDRANTFLQSIGYGGAFHQKDPDTGWHYTMRVIIVIADERETT